MKKLLFLSLFIAPCLFADDEETTTNQSMFMHGFSVQQGGPFNANLCLSTAQNPQSYNDCLTDSGTKEQCTAALKDLNCPGSDGSDNCKKVRDKFNTFK